MNDSCPPLPPVPRLETPTAALPPVPALDSGDAPAAGVPRFSPSAAGELFSEAAAPPPVPALPPVPPAENGANADVSFTDPAADDAAFPFPPAAAPAAIDAAALAENPTPFRRFWRRFGGDSFIISIGIHAALLFIALTYVVSVVVINDSKPETFDTGAGGGNHGDVTSMTQHRIKPKSARNMVRTPARILSKSSAASVTLPDVPSLSVFQSGSALAGAAGAVSKGRDGGAGGGEGPGLGPGRGGARNMVSLFGVRGFVGGGIEGTFYDFKQDPRRHPKDPGIHGYISLVMQFMQSGWNTSFVKKRFYAAPNRLTLSQVFIPWMPADAAPAAYGVADRCAPKRWMAHYKGTVKAPMTGKFRFVGSADDWIAVRWNGKSVLSGGYNMVAPPPKPKGAPDVPIETRPSRLPRPLVCGTWLSVTKDASYPLEIAIGETPGGVFWAYLFFETEDAPGKLKLFRLNTEPLPEEIKNGHPQVPGVDMSGGALVWWPPSARPKPR